MHFIIKCLYLLCSCRKNFICPLISKSLNELSCKKRELLFGLATLKIQNNHVKVLNVKQKKIHFVDLQCLWRITKNENKKTNKKIFNKNFKLLVFY